MDLFSGGQHVFVTASRHTPEVELWLRDGNTLRAAGGDRAADFTTDVVVDPWYQDADLRFKTLLFMAGTGTLDLLDGRYGADTRLGELGDDDFDTCAAQVFRVS